MRKLVLSVVFVLSFAIARSQTGKTGSFAREFSFTTENDAYLFQRKDAYYTNGFFFALRKAKEKKGKKVLEAFELGQKIYTPLTRKIVEPSEIDRPYCGYLFVQFSHTSFITNRSVLQYTASIGQVGTASFGEDVQNSYHKLLGYSRFNGWIYQVQDATALDLGISYAHTVYEDSSWIKLMPVVQANLGATFANASLGTYLCLGSFEGNRNSALWNARAQTKATATRKKQELFLYWYPQMTFQGYNATVEGGLFNKGNGGAALRQTERWMFQQSWGICYAAGRWTTKAALVYQSKETVTQTRPQQYGSVLVSYCMH